jgi:hypothetical protein
LGAHHGKLDADLRIFALLGTPSVQSIHANHPFAMEDAGRLAPMAVAFVDRLANLVVGRRFPSMGAVDSRSLRFDIYYVRMRHFVRRTTTYVPFQRFWEMCDVNSCNVFMLLFMVLWVPIFATLFRRAVLTLRHAFMFPGLRFFPLFFVLLVSLHCLLL